MQVGQLPDEAALVHVHMKLRLDFEFHRHAQHVRVRLDLGHRLRGQARQRMPRHAKFHAVDIDDVIGEPL